jgi:hypothetical protein
MKLKILLTLFASLSAHPSFGRRPTSPATDLGVQSIADQGAMTDGVAATATPVQVDPIVVNHALPMEPQRASCLRRVLGRLDLARSDRMYTNITPHRQPTSLCRSILSDIANTAAGVVFGPALCVTTPFVIATMKMDRWMGQMDSRYRDERYNNLTPGTH